MTGITLPRLVTAAGDRLGRAGPVVALLRPVYSAYLQAVYGRRGVPWHVNGEPLRIDPAARHLIPHTGEEPLFQFLRAGIRPGDVILDIGSFLGCYAVMAARWSGETGRVLAFEPSPASYTMLRRHLAMNRVESRVDARPAAVGARPERRTLTTFGEEPYRNMIMHAPSGAPSISVETVTVDAVCATLGRPPDWIRMDVQGLEFEVLEGARDVIHEARGRLNIVAEMHPEQWPDHGIEAGDVVHRLADLGLRARPLEPGGPLFVQGAHAVLEPLRP
jgi:FkbM family methyltransferase